MIAAKHLTLKLGGATVLDDVSLELAPGRMTAIVGANGAGKTSLLRSLAGLVAPEGGSIALEGASILSLSASDRAKAIGYLPQDGEPAWNVTARELVGLGRLPYRSHLSAPSQADEEAVEAALEVTDAARFADRTLSTLSGGEKARVKMARVLAGEPRWILADEPLANLDPPHQRDALALFRKAAEAGAGVATVLHQLDAAATADDVLILKAGKLIAFGPVRAVLTAGNLENAFDMKFDVIDHKGRPVIVPL